MSIYNCFIYVITDYYYSACFFLHIYLEVQFINDTHSHSLSHTHTPITMFP